MTILERKAKVCKMYANGISQMQISKELKIPMFEISRIIKQDYLGIVNCNTPVHVVKQSKV